MKNQTNNEYSIKNYLIGFTLSLLLTLLIFFFVIKAASGDIRTTVGFSVAMIIGVAILQLIVQVIFFLHLSGKSSSERWRTLAFSFMGLVVLIIVIGSLWIMNNLDYNMMHEHTMEKGLEKVQGSGF